MLTVTGEVRKVIDDSYIKSGKKVIQYLLIIEPLEGRQNFEVSLTDDQAKASLKTWEKIKGMQASVAVSLYVNYEYKFQKFNAVGDGSPLG